MAEQDKDKKLIIDEDWKNQAQRDKEKLAEQEAQEEHDEGGEETGLPPADLTGLASMLATQAFFALGLIGREGEPQRQPDFVLGKFHIDMLEMLEQKTAGNRTDDETKMLTGTLGQLRMAFVQLAEKAS
jgi:hypothetical protein